uniref:PIPK domain-containing protein n=1 Tax=Ascaris lumbricoides TaxID=6252 RepID=A0A0M3HGD5_ASCLU
MRRRHSDTNIGRTVDGMPWRRLSESTARDLGFLIISRPGSAAMTAPHASLKRKKRDVLHFSSLISAHQVTFLWDLYISMNRPFRVPRAYLVGPDVMMIAFHKHIIKKQYSGGIRRELIRAFRRNWDWERDLTTSGEGDQLVPNDRLTEKFDVPTDDFSRLVL